MWTVTTQPTHKKPWHVPGVDAATSGTEADLDDLRAEVEHLRRETQHIREEQLAPPPQYVL